MSILVVGDINIDVVLSGYREFPRVGCEVTVQDSALMLGCAACITAIGLVKLGNEVAFVGKTGRDFIGDYCLEKMAEAGLDVSRVIRDPSVKTGITVSISSEKDRALISHPGAMTRLTDKEIPDEFFAGFDHLHLSSYYLHEQLRPDYGSLFSRARKRGLTISVDPCHDPTDRWEPDLWDLLPLVDVFLPNEVEIRGITGQADPLEGLKRLTKGRTLTVGKFGPEGAVIFSDGKLLRQSAPPVRPVDPTGAGDSFNSGFLHGWVRGWCLEDSLRLGVACGSFSTQALGGITHQATLTQALDFLKDYESRAD